MEKRKRQRPARPAGGDFTLAEWCQLRRISLAMFYKLDGQGKAPAVALKKAKGDLECPTLHLQAKWAPTC